MLLSNIEELLRHEPPIIYISGDTVAHREYNLSDPQRGPWIDVIVNARRLGHDPGQDILYEWGSVLIYAASEHRKGIKQGLLPGELLRFHQWLQDNPI